MKLNSILDLKSERILNFMLSFYINKLHSLNRLILTENSLISTHNLDLLFQLLKNGLEYDKKEFRKCLNLNNKSTKEQKESIMNQNSISQMTITLLNYLVSLFPIIPKQYLLKVGPILLVSFIIMII